MASALEMEREARPAYVEFKRIPIEDKAETLKQGHYVAKDVDYAYITPSYSKDVMKHKCSVWFPQLEIDKRNGRIPESWVEAYKKQYEAFKNGQELPVNGVPIKGWGIISPAQQETLIKMKILTVEDLSKANDEGIKRIGMGGLELKNKAVAWLKELDDKGSSSIEIADLKQQLVNAEGVIENQKTQIEDMKRRLNLYENESQPTVVEESTEITAVDILEDAAPSQKRKRSK